MQIRSGSPLAEAMRSIRRAFVGVAAFSAAVNILMLTGPLFMLQVYDRVMASRSVPTLIGLFALVCLAYAFMGLYDLLRARLLSRAGYRLDEAVGTETFRIWVESGLAGQGGKLIRPMHELSTVRSFLAGPALLGVFDLPWVPFYLLILWLVHWQLGVLAICGAFVVGLLALFNQLLTRAPLRESMMRDAEESFFVDQCRRSAEALLPMGMAGVMQDRWQRMHEAGLARGQEGAERGESFSAASKAFRMLLQSALLGYGAYLAIYQEISAGMIVAGSIIAGRALAPLDQVIGQWRHLQKARQSWGKLQEALAGATAPRPFVELPRPNGPLEALKLGKLVPGRGEELRAILDGVSFRLEPGDGLGVIGPSASGKTTLARILVGAWQPDSGTVRLDKATLDQYGEAARARHIGYLPQEVGLLSGSIRDNIARFDAEAQDSEIVEAARLAGVHEMILSLPDGYLTEVGFGAPPLSAGQVQRVGLARALFRLPRLIVLDEPNANLDVQGDDALTAAIGAARASGSIVVVMAHRPSAIAAVNKVLMMQSGRMVEFGDKADVLRKVTRVAVPQPVAEAGE